MWCFPTWQTNRNLTCFSFTTSQEPENSCQNVHCPSGYACAVVQGKSVCKCSSECTFEDRTSGPVCTTDFRQFRTRCDFIRERCRHREIVLKEMECPPAEHVCRPRSHNAIPRMGTSGYGDEEPSEDSLFPNAPLVSV